MDPRAARASALGLLALGALLWPAARAWELTILHTNDVHSRLEQTSEDASKCVNASRCVGGAARLATKVHQIRRAEPHVLLLDAGDQYQGTIWFTVYKGAEVAHFMNALGYDAMALGNHEFDNGVEGLINPLLKEAKFPILSANIKAKGPLASKISGLYLPYKILSVGEEVVGIVGYTSKETPFLSNPGPNLVFEDEIAALQPEVDKLKTLNVNKIIALGHSGFEVDKLIAQKVKGVDVVVGGHTNTFLYTGNTFGSQERRVCPEVARLKGGCTQAVLSTSSSSCFTSPTQLVEELDRGELAAGAWLPLTYGFLHRKGIHILSDLKKS